MELALVSLSVTMVILLTMIGIRLDTIIALLREGNGK